MFLMSTSKPFNDVKINPRLGMTNVSTRSRCLNSNQVIWSMCNEIFRDCGQWEPLFRKPKTQFMEVDSTL